MNLCNKFRLKMQANKTLNWDRIDEDLRARYLHTVRVVCHNCHNYGHISPHCPSANTPSSRITSGRAPAVNRPRPLLPVGRSSSSGALPSGGTRPQFCFSYNYNGFCTNYQCPYKHSCMDCSGNHPKSHCVTHPLHPPPSN